MRGRVKPFKRQTLQQTARLPPKPPQHKKTGRRQGRRGTCCARGSAGRGGSWAARARMCPGITALLRVVQAKKIRRPRDDQQQCGQLLVAERVTDPAVGRLRDDRGWRRVQRSSMYRRWVHRSIAAASPRSLITHNHCALAGRAHTHAPTHKPSATVSFGHRNLSPDASNPLPDFPIGAVQLLTSGRECSSSLAPEPTHPPSTSGDTSP